MVLVAASKVLATLMARIYVAEMRRSGNFRLLASRTLLGKVLGGLGGILVALQGGGAWALIVQALIMELVSLLMLMRNDPRRLPLVFDRPWLAGVLVAGLPIAINTLCGQLLQRGASVVLGLTVGVQAVGQFNFALRIIELPRTAVHNGLASYALPAFARRVEQPARLWSLFGAVSSLTGFLLTPCYIGLALTAEDLVLLVFGTKWLAAVPTLQVLAVMAALANTALHAQSLLVAVSRIQTVVRAEVVTTLLALALLGLLGEPLGALAGGLAMLARTLLIVPIHVAALRRSIGFGALDWLLTNYRSLLATLLMSIAVLYFSTHSTLGGYAHWLADICVGALAYALAYSLLHPRWWPDFKGMLAMR
jgi:O-antigen/teichoic acid export membrane protein